MVQEVLGHSSVSVTMDVYSHVLPDMQEKAAEAMDGLLSDDRQLSIQLAKALGEVPQACAIP